MESETHVPTRIMRGVSALLDIDPTSAGPWDTWEAIARARMHAVNVSHQQTLKKAVNILYVVSLIATISFILTSIIITLLG